MIEPVDFLFCEYDPWPHGEMLVPTDYADNRRGEGMKKVLRIFLLSEESAYMLLCLMAKEHYHKILNMDI
ncbi:MAG: hypothetical protein CO098_04215 [Bacteroidetes bacterium CG_4_9_14_3_um_filter_41_19]|nr:MAG: hypothetical protein CO098_04215 [Bacteroidetes bacterium CG_4_9_14_3_um_filter_41_19]